MECESELLMGEGTCETLLNVLGALVRDYVEEEHRPSEESFLRAFDRFLGTLPNLHRSGIIWLLRALEMAPQAPTVARG